MLDFLTRADRPAPRGTFAELSSVVLTSAVAAAEGLLPAGTRGTVVAVYADQLGYEVEFDEPVHAVVTLGADALKAP